MIVKCLVCGKDKESSQMFKIRISSNPLFSPVGVCKMCKGETKG